jgi:hypothetical protein
MTYGRDAVDTAGFFLGMGPIRFMLEQTGRTADEVRETVTAAFRPYEGPAASG